MQILVEEIPTTELHIQKLDRINLQVLPDVTNYG